MWAADRPYTPGGYGYTGGSVYSAAQGGDVAVDRIFAVTITSGSLDVTFTGVTSHAAINAIEVVPSGT